jgi:GT2 family glycosyltransferase
MEKIGLGVVTYKREDYFKRTFKTVPLDVLDEVVVVNDGTPYDNSVYNGVHLIQSPTNEGVAKAKNKALRYLLNKGCDHIFLKEDDIFIDNKEVFNAYIHASKITRIQHFNYALHGFANKTKEGQEYFKFKCDIKGVVIPFYHNCVGAFSYYSRKCLTEVGLIDEHFYNAFDHVDHTYQISKANLHPPFWYFADIDNSSKYLSDIEWSIDSSTISSRSDHNGLARNALSYFEKKNGISLFDIPNVSRDEVLTNLLSIYKNG